MKNESATQAEQRQVRRRQRMQKQIASLRESREKSFRILGVLKNRRARHVIDVTGLRRPPVELVRSRGRDGDGDRVPVVAGEILAREGERFDELRVFLRTRGYEPTRRTCRGRVVFTRQTERAVARRARDGRLEPQAASADTPVTDVIEEARAEGFDDVEPNHVVALNWVMKSMIGPETAEAGDRPEAPDPMPTDDDAPLVVVIDTGLDANAVARDDRWLDGVSVSLSTDYDPLDQLDKDGSLSPEGNGFLDLSAGHGTFVAGIVRQVEPAADVVVLRALDADGLGTDDGLADAIERAATIIGARPAVINLSLGMHTFDDTPPSEMGTALESLPSNVLVVAAAGNDADERELWPAAFEDVVGVAGLTENGARADWSSHGPWVTCSALGQDLVSTYVNGLEQEPDPQNPGDDPPWDPEPEEFLEDDPCALWLGTSFAAPQVAARLARLAVDHGVDSALSILEAEKVADLSGEGCGFALELITPA